MLHASLPAATPACTNACYPRLLPAAEHRAAWWGTDRDLARSTAILAAIRAAIQKYTSPVPVDVTATIAQQRRLLLQSTPSYTVDIQVV